MRVVAAFLLVLCHLAISHAWTCTDAPRLRYPRQIDAGLGQVVATDRSYNAYFLSGTSWQRLPSARLKHVTVGPAGIWGVSSTDNIYKFVGGLWKSTGGSLKQVDAGGKAYVVGANRSDQPFCLRSRYTEGYTGSGGVSWNYMGGSMKYYSCGPYGCWAVNSANGVYVMRSVNPTTCKHTGWMHISGVSLTMIEVGTDGSVFGVTTTGELYQRVGVSSGRPQGTAWSRVHVGVKHVTCDLGRLWLISKSGLLMQCTP